MYPNDRRYTKSHEWVLIAGGTATVGITDFAQNELGDITNVELPAVGRTVVRGEVVATIDSTKAVSEVYAPVAGTVSDVNAEILKAPDQLNRDPHGAGWIFRIAASNPAEADALLDAAGYEGLVGA